MWKYIIMLIIPLILSIFIVCLGIEPTIEKPCEDIVFTRKHIGEILDKFIEILALVVIPFILHHIGSLDRKRKEEQDELENKRKEKNDKKLALQKYYHDIIQPIVKKIQDISDNRQQSIINMYDVDKNDTIEVETTIKKNHTQALLDFANLLKYIGNLTTSIDNIKHNISFNMDIFKKIADQLQVLSKIIMNITETGTTQKLIDSPNNHLAYEFMRIIISYTDRLIDLLESTFIYQLYNDDDSYTSEMLESLDNSFQTDVLEKVKEVTGVYR